jgi:hypothetical protein
MDNHKPVMIFILHFKTRKRCNFCLFKKICLENFRIWPYAWKTKFVFVFLERKINLKFLKFFWNFFREISEKIRYFNTRSVSYCVSIQTWYYAKLVEKYVARVRRRDENIHPQNCYLMCKNVGRQGILVFY